ncbi:hypothetical protein BGZ95_010704 [Linnemannia exigua]|uniref:Uncharacterized protein n=1 Tax=Linnemannia exigua TaxID=604196 RepID=A0AAD4DAY5_9FUNG|nr:hypothetical protein BGZ95_010704 [Linnemannia exigua]
MGFFVICAGVVLLQTSKRHDAAAAAMAAALKKSRSSLSLQDEESLIEDEKEVVVEPGPLGLRAVPFDSIRQMVRASTMPSTPFTVPHTPVAVIPVGEEDAHHQKPPRSIGRQLFAKFGRKGDAADNTPASTPSTPQQLRHQQDEGTPLQGVVIIPTTTATTPAHQGGEKQELRESEEFDEKQRGGPYRMEGVMVPMSAVPQFDDDREEERSPLSSKALTLHD